MNIVESSVKAASVGSSILGRELETIYYDVKRCSLNSSTFRTAKNDFTAKRLDLSYDFLKLLLKCFVPAIFRVDH